MTGPDCKCKYRCFSKINDVQMQSVLKQFCNIGDKHKQDIYLAGLISAETIKRRRVKTGGGSARSIAFHYKIRLGTETHVVCKKAFCSVHGVSKHRVNGVATKLKDGDLTAKQDGRGRHGNRANKISDEIVAQIDEHIRSFPRRRSHYSRSDNEKRYYLSSELNIKNYIDGKNIDPKVSYDFYYRHFNYNYNISFGNPRSDTCQKCDKLENSIVAEEDLEAKSKLQQEKTLHLAKAEAFYTSLKEKSARAKNEKAVEVLCFDYQQNMPLPHTPSGDVFYKRQLWVYNFCVHSAKTSESKFYMYDEITAKKGSNEVISFLLHYMDTFLPPTVSELHLFYDNCFAQNKNSVLVHFLHTYINTTGRNIRAIAHQFPEPGHSFLPCDRSFGLIEKEKRRKEVVYTPKGWIDLVRMTSKTFTVIEVSQDMILNFREHFKGFMKKSVTNKEKEKFSISKYRVFKYEKTSVVKCSVSTGLTLFSDFAFKKSSAPYSLPSEKLYHSYPLPIKQKKLQNVRSLAEAYVPKNDQWYYDIVFNAVGPEISQENMDSDDEDVEIEMF
ncbi:dna-directed rna polymerases i ii and iii subunit rpabc2 [Holotrichia oblita]|uniref:Dna-directed rna polymerases i ii and iii subunit rpabc2 n=1 Tax=Holotrichia oblita TaxID=644536 RepID=A0ACB9T901_HOLOL|nr:dna-directed rna polymerases i ii and iii subunit rpabc2 [Holotrichia oblita]